MNRPSIVTLLTLIAALESAACGTISSSYTRTTAAPQEILWTFSEGDFTPTQSGHEINGYKALAQAVRCVPKAAGKASAARRWTSFGWTALIAGGAGLAGGTGLLIAGAQDGSSSSDLLLAGGVTAGSSLVVAIVGAIAFGAAVPAQLDAVNIYNDERESSAACAAGSD